MSTQTNKVCESVFSAKQLHMFSSHISDSFEVLVTWIKDKPKDLKKIIYLAEEIVELAKSIPSFLNGSDKIDMSAEVCNDVISIASQATKFQLGLEVDISKEISSIDQRYSY